MADNRRWNQSMYRNKLFSRLLPAMNPDALPVETVAQRLGRSPVWLYKALEGEIVPLPEDIPLIYNASKDIEVINWLVRQCDGLALRSTVFGELSGDFDDDLEDVVLSASRLFKERRAALADKKLSDIEYDKLSTMITELRQQVDTMEAELKAMHGVSQ